MYRKIRILTPSLSLVLWREKGAKEIRPKSDAAPNMAYGVELERQARVGLWNTFRSLRGSLVLQLRANVTYWSVAGKNKKGEIKGKLVPLV